jgi:lysophospholipase
MGGCLTLLALARGEARNFEACLLSAPMLGIQTGGVPLAAARLVAGLNVLLGRRGAYARPNGPEGTFEQNRLTHDRARWTRNSDQVKQHPDLALGNPTWGWLDFAFRATAYLAQPANLKSVTIPVVICSAEEDKLVDNAAQKAVARSLPNGEFVNVPGAYHEILMETDTMRNIFLRALDAILGRPAPAPAKPAAAAEPKAEPKPEPKAEPPAPAAPAAAKAEPAAPAPAASGVGFAVQMGAFASTAEANALRDRLRAAGFSAIVQPVRTDKGTLNRVRVGPVSTRAEADQLKARLASGFGAGMVVPHP